MTTYLTEQHLRESVAIAALAEVGRLDLVKEVIPEPSGSDLKWNVWPTKNMSHPIIYRAFAMDVMSRGRRVPCPDCCRITPSFENNGRLCTHEVRF